MCGQVLPLMESFLGSDEKICQSSLLFFECLSLRARLSEIQSLCENESDSLMFLLSSLTFPFLFSPQL